MQPAALVRAVLDLNRGKIQRPIVSFDAGQQQLAGQFREMSEFEPEAGSADVDRQPLRTHGVVGCQVRSDGNGHGGFRDVVTRVALLEHAQGGDGVRTRGCCVIVFRCVRAAHRVPLAGKGDTYRTNQRGGHATRVVQAVVSAVPDGFDQEFGFGPRGAEEHVRIGGEGAQRGDQV